MESQVTSIPVTPNTRDQVRRLKRGGETWDELVRRMADQYDPDPETEGDDVSA